MLAGWANDGQPVFTARFDSAESRSFTPQLVRETIRHALGLLPPKLNGVKASEKCPSCRAPFGPHGEHIDVCRCSPSITLDHDDAARALTRGLRRIGVNALHESTAPIDVSVDPDHVNTPDVMIESLENGPFSLDVAIMRPGVSPATSVSAMRCQYIYKMRAYYGRLAGDALLHASTSDNDNVRHSFFLNNGESDKLIVLRDTYVCELQQLRKDHAQKQPGFKMKDDPTSDMPMRPVRPLIMNGLTGTLEARSRRTIRDLVKTQVSPHAEPHEVARRTNDLLHAVALAMLSTAAQRRIMNHAKWRPLPGEEDR